MLCSDLKKALKIFCRVGPALDREEVDDLNEEFGVTGAGFAHRVDQFAKSGQESIMTNPQERTAGNVANAGGFDNERARLPGGESSIPIEVVRRHKSIFSGAPGDHRRHPSAALQLERSDC